MKYFTADLHFCHSNLIKPELPFRMQFKDIKEHDEYIMNMWNEIVTDEDDVYVVGDMFLKNIKKSRWILEQLKGRINLVLGNHDQIALKLQKTTNRFSTITNRIHLKIPDENAHRNQQDIILDHFAGIVWNKCHYGSWQLFGHSHGRLDPKTLSPRQMDVGIDVHHRLITYDEIKNMIKENEQNR